MDIVAIIAISGLALVVVGLALKLSKESDKRKDAQVRAHQLETQFSETSKEFARYKRDAMAQLSELRDDIKQLEADLDGCTAPGARKQRLERLLSKAGGKSSALSNQDPSGVSGGGGSAP